MTKALTTHQALPTDARTGLTLPLSRSLASQDLAKHRAMVALELEVMAKKMDRFGWDRDRGSAAHDRLLTDWMDALHDFPLEEIKGACRKWVADNPRRMPNEGDIRRVILAERQKVVDMLPKPEPVPERKPVTAEAAQEILAKAGFAPNRIGGGHE